MNNTIETIIEMDKAARDKIRRAEAEAQRINADTEKKLSNLEKSFKAQTDTEIKKSCGEIKKDADKEIEKITADCDKKCRKLDEILEKNADIMCRTIVDRIFKGTVNNG